ncbi:nitroreductase family protein [Dongshaea marina]|uniref:nitroreductase family protein n=1 Tax=Dongshaea marina TaxID=2047966 RepID=UPI000D3E8B01|nr:nitroreductase family protein [Dongshaea marina]
MPLPLILVLLLLGGIIYLVGAAKTAAVICAVPALLLLILLFDIISCKFGFRLPEPLAKSSGELSVFELIRARRSCRSYQKRDLTSADMDSLMVSVRKHSHQARLGAAPIRFEFVSAPITVWPVVNARHFLVAIAPAEYDRVAIIDIGRTLQKIVIDATRIGLGTCWIGPGADHKSVVKHLGDRFNPEQDSIICLCAVGYRSIYIPLFIRFFNSQVRRRLPLSALFFSDPTMTQSLPVRSEPFRMFGQAYESCRWAPSSYNGQTTRCVAISINGKPGNPNDEPLFRFDFYSVTASRYYAAVAVGIWCSNWEMSCDALGIAGKFRILNDEQREASQIPQRQTLPRYDVSWIMDSAG